MSRTRASSRRRHRGGTLGGLALVMGAGVVAWAGCTGQAGFELISLRMHDLNPALPQSTRFRASECYYRVDAEGKIRVAMRYQNLAWFGPLSRVTFTLSFLLEEPPAGRARNYRLGGESVRGWAMAGPEAHRLRSTHGIAVIYDVREHTLRGRFRCYVRHQKGSLLTGWRGNALLLLMGEFDAVKNEERAGELEAESEAGDWARAAKGVGTPSSARIGQAQPEAQEGKEAGS